MFESEESSRLEKICCHSDCCKVRGKFKELPDFFVQKCKIVVDSWKFSMSLLYIVWDDWPIFIISGWNEQLQQELEYTLIKPLCHSLLNFKNAIWTWWHFRKTICNKIVFNLEKMLQKRMECFRLLLEHLLWIENQVLSGIRDSRKAGSLWWMMRCVGGVMKSVHHSWLAKQLGLRLLCWGFKGVQEETSTLEIGSVGFPRRTMHQSTTPSLSQTIWPRWASRQFLSLPMV